MILEKVYEINNSTTTQEEKLRRQSRFMDDLLNQQSINQLDWLKKLENPNLRNDIPKIPPPNKSRRGTMKPNKKINIVSSNIRSVENAATNFYPNEHDLQKSYNYKIPEEMKG